MTAPTIRSRLAVLPPRLTTQAPRLGYAKDDQRATERYRRANHPSKGWYKSTWWQQMRRRILLRDLYKCQSPGCGKLVAGKGEAHVDHIDPHNEDYQAFHCSEDGLQTLCASCHSGKKQAEERKLGLNL